MMNLHKLSAGNGYTYLTRQVAANDAADTGYANLGEYYSERGESPGVWLGQGLAGLGGGPRPGDVVREAQMVALFGHGRHPNADALEQRAAAMGTEVDTSLGKPFAVRAASSEFRRELARRIVAHNRGRGRRPNAPVSDEDRAGLRSELGREWFLRDHGREPLDPRELTDYVIGASRPGRQSVAGYDLTFSPVKSVSALWALADPAMAREIAAAHDAAVRDVVGWLEREAVYTRVGAGGPQQVDTRGLLAVAFTHRDSRAGDPDLHTHVAISNKVQAADGRWLALDGRPLHRAAVAASERYNTRLEALLTARLGVRFAERPDDGGKRPVREVVGVDPRLARFWSKRRQVITARQEQLATEFATRRGRTPDFAEQTRLFAQATTDTRQRKHAPRSEHEQRAAWWGEVASVLGSDQAIAAMLQQVTAQPALPVPDTIDEAWVARTAADVVRAAAERASTWHSSTIRSEIERRARYGDVPHAHLDAVVEGGPCPRAVPGAVGAARTRRRDPRTDRLTADGRVERVRGRRHAAVHVHGGPRSRGAHPGCRISHRRRNRCRQRRRAGSARGASQWHTGQRRAGGARPIARDVRLSRAVRIGSRRGGEDDGARCARPRVGGRRRNGRRARTDRTRG
jgi:conjugative relaxase-like TrwC/TraI family protein